MVKLQRLDRKDGTSIYSVTIPKKVVEQAGLSKGKVLFVELVSQGVLIKEVKNERV